MSVLKFLSHSKKAIMIAADHGWLPGARYTNLRDVKSFEKLGFLDIDWKNYNFQRHLEAVIKTRPLITVAKDIENLKEFETILSQANELANFAQHVVIVPKDLRLKNIFNQIPDKFILGYSVPTRYGGTDIPIKYFNRPVHLLGGRPDIQRELAKTIPVVSIDGNRFTLDAKFGDFFDGKKFTAHPLGGYENCLIDSIKNINQLWKNYNIKVVN